MVLNVISAPPGWDKYVPEGAPLYVLESSFAERQAAKDARLRWNPDRKRWWTTEIDRALCLLDCASPDCRKALEAARAGKIASVEASQATDADVEIPRPDGLEYLPYQKAGIAFGLNRPSVLLADEMGLGKTIQAIGYINSTPDVDSVLVICPATLKLNWARELKKWLTRPMSIAVVDGTWPNADICIVNYDILKKHKASLQARTWGLLISDEAHYLKNSKAQRTAMVIGKWSRVPEERIPAIGARHRWFLSGTPIVNCPAELWPLIHSLDPQTWKSWKYYVERYCGASQTRYGWDVSNATNLDELQRKLRETIMVRRLKMDVLKELPAKRRQIVVMPAGSCQTYVNAENAAYDAIAERTAELRSRLELAKADDDDAAYKGIVAEMSREAMCDFTDISRVRHDTAVAKAPLVAEYVKEVLDNAGKVVLFAHHHDVLDVLERELKEFGLVRLDGNTPMAARQQAVDRFQNDSSVRVFLGGIIPAGVGITLTAASTVIFAELDWVPGNVTQAEDRCHRIGQTDSVTVYHIVLEGSIDEKMATTVVDKQEIIDKALNGGGQTQDEASKHVAIPVECATRTVSREQIATEAVSLTPNQVEAIHAALRFLSAHDQDYARTVNGVGYSKIDGNIGHSLSERIFLTPKQAVLGKKIALKYRRQLPEELVSTIKGE